MKLWLRLLALLMVACMMMGCLAACGEDEGKKRDDDDDERTHEEDEGEENDDKGDESDGGRTVNYITKWEAVDNRYGTTLTVTFQYNDDYTGGTAIYDASYYSGPAEFTFTCDEDGHITSLSGSVDGNELSYLLEYDEAGRKTYYAYNTENGWETWEYDENGNVVQHQDRFTDFLIVTDYSYDENGNLQQTVETLYDQTGYQMGQDKMVYTLDENGLASAAAFYEDGNYTKDFLYYYDEEGRLVTVEEYPGSYIPYVYEYEWRNDMDYTIYSYDQDGYKLQEECFNYCSDGRFDSHVLYTYSSENTFQVTLEEHCYWESVDRP